MPRKRKKQLSGQIWLLIKVSIRVTIECNEDHHNDTFQALPIVLHAACGFVDPLYTSVMSLILSVTTVTLLLGMTAKTLMLLSTHHADID